MTAPTDTFTFDPYDLDVIANPLPYYEVLRRDHPAYFIPEYDTFVVSRFEDVFQVLSDPDGHFTTTDGTVVGRDELLRHNVHGTVPAERLQPLDKLARLNNPLYGEIRHAFGAPLRPGATRRIAPFVREQALDVLDGLDGRDSFNLVAEYGGQVAARTMCLLFGLDLADANTLLESVNAFTEKDPVTGAFDEARKGRIEEFAFWTVAQRRAAGADGSLPAVDGLINFVYDGRKLTDQEIVNQLVIVLMGGTETVPKVVAHGLLELQRHPDQRAEIGTDPDLIATAFEEILRYCAPAQWFMRTVAKPVTIAGQRMEVGQRVIPLNMSANRDDREFDDPEEFRWNRRIERHVAFGQGMKFCIGSHVARLEGRILLQEFLLRFPDYRIDEETLLRPASSFQWGFMRMTTSTY